MLAAERKRQHIREIHDKDSGDVRKNDEAHSNRIISILIYKCVKLLQGSQTYHQYIVRVPVQRLAPLPFIVQYAHHL